MLEKFTTKAGELNNYIEHTVNTKSEIKEGVRDIKYQVECINRKVRDLEEMPARLKTRSVQKLNKSSEAQTDQSGREVKNVSSVGVQTDMDEMQNGRENMETTTREEVIKILDTGGDFKNLRTILDKKWPEEAYKMTAIEIGDLRDAELSDDLAVIIDPGEEQGGRGIMALLHRFPAVENLFKEGLIEGQVEVITV